ncbi:MAG TPA: hypothetical protein VFV87_15730, partial [Pirellulaceae bacterium]|nr:hypothetical protein [Pirellulaceae bacterium]
MRSFVAATCCLIVGLEILIGVPVAICLGFLCLGAGAAPGVYVSEAQFDAPTCPPPIYSSPVYSPGPVPCGPYDPSYPPSSQSPSPMKPSVCPVPMAPGVVASLPASDSAADPLPHCTSNSTVSEYPIAATSSADGLQPQLFAHVCLEGDCPAGQSDRADSTRKSSPESALAEALLATATLLYQQADGHEIEQEYALADRLRALARDLRDEASSIGRRSPDYDFGPVSD